MGGLHFNLEAYTPNKKLHESLIRVGYLYLITGEGSTATAVLRDLTLCLCETWTFWVKLIRVNKPEFEAKYNAFFNYCICKLDFV